MTVTIKQIAERAGYSWPTVSRVLNGRKGHFSEDTRMRILLAANELGYRAHAAARAARTGRFGHIAMLTRWDVGVSQFNLNKGVAWELAAHDLHMTYAEADLDQLTDPEETPKMLRELCVDGAIVHLNKYIDHPAIDVFNEYGLPAVWVNVDGPNNCVHPDDLQGARLATQTLIEAGHRSIGYVDALDPKNNHFSVAARRNGYQQAMAEAGLPATVFQPAQPLVRDGVQASLEYWRGILKAHSHITGWVAYDDINDAAILGAALSLGLRIPADLSLIGFHTVVRSGLIGLPISNMHLSMQKVGREAVRMLCQRIESGASVLPSRAVAYKAPESATIGSPTPNTS